MIPIHDLPRHSPHAAPFDFALLLATDSLADRLFRLRRHLRLQRADMAAKMGVAVRDYCDFEDGLAAPAPNALAGLVFHIDGLSLKWLTHGKGLPFPHSKDFPPGREARSAMVKPAREGAQTCRSRGKSRGAGRSPVSLRRRAFLIDLFSALLTASAILALFFMWGLS